MDKKGTRPSTSTSNTRGDLSARKTGASALGTKRPSILPPNTKDLSRTYNHNARGESKDAGIAKKPGSSLNVSILFVSKF